VYIHRYSLEYWFWESVSSWKPIVGFHRSNGSWCVPPSCWWFTYLYICRYVCIYVVILSHTGGIFIAAVGRNACRRAVDYYVCWVEETPPRTPHVMLRMRSANWQWILIITAMGRNACRLAVDYCVRWVDETPPRTPHVILDPFCGHGSVLAEANRQGVAAYGIDLSAACCRVASNYTA